MARSSRVTAKHEPQVLSYLTRSAPHGGKPWTTAIGRSAAGSSPIRGIRLHAHCGPHAGGPRPSPQPSAVHLPASAAYPPMPVHPPGARCGQRRRPRFGRLDAVTTGPLRSPVRVPQDLRERDPAPGPDESHSQRHIQPEPQHLDPPSGTWCPAPAAAADQGSTLPIASPGMTSCQQVARPAAKRQSRSRHGCCLLADTSADRHPLHRRGR